MLTKDFIEFCFFPGLLLSNLKAQKNFQEGEKKKACMHTFSKL
jgi:hypothetical protein